MKMMKAFAQGGDSTGRRLGVVSNFNRSAARRNALAAFSNPRFQRQFGPRVRNPRIRG
jgi:hypothetical protein